MDLLEICFNKHSLPANTALEASLLLENALQGVQILLSAPQHKGNRPCICYDNSDPGTIPLTNYGFTLKDFTSRLSATNPDLAELFVNLVEKAPFTDFISDNQLYKLVLNRYGVNGLYSDIDLLIYALDWNLYILSLALHQYDKKKIPCHSREQKDKTLYIKNICNIETAQDHITTPQTHSSHRYKNSRIYIYAGDHPPPHAHIISDNSRCSISILPESLGTILVGSLSPKDGEVLEYIKDHHATLVDHWNYKNP